MDLLDRRVRKTRQALSDALVALILERGYDAITVKDITQRADVAYATFYRHFRDKDELLGERLKAVVMEIEAFTREVSLQDAEGYLIFKHAEENSALYRVLFSSEGTLRVRKYIRDLLAANFQRTCKPLITLPHPSIPPEIAAYHMASSLLSMIEWWIEQKMPYSAHHMSSIYERLVTGATLHLIANQPGMDLSNR